MMRQLLSLFIATLCLSLSSATINQSTNQSINQPSTINYPDFADFKGKPFTVTYNARALLLNDNPSIFLSGSVHYPRFSVGQWLPMLQQAKAEGLNLVQIYVFWNGHEPSEGEFNWDDRYDLVRFLDAVVEAGLFANLRIGPYVCAEWDLGGIPAWLQFNRPGIRYRSFESQWRLAMKTWFGQVVAKTRSYFSDHGGPIILVQVENELNGADERYVQWCGDMAASFNLNVPIAMCNGQSANGTDVAIHPSRHTKDINDEVYVGAGAVTINTCNANDCTGFLSTHGQNHRILLDQPAIWTENEMWFTSWFDSTNPIYEGGNRTSQDVGFAVMRFIARGGSVSNDYMYFGGNNYGATAGGGVTTMYANGAHHHSDNLPNEPRYTNMNMMYQLLPKIANDLANNPAALDLAIPLEYRDGPSDPWKLGTQQLAFEYGKNLAFVESSAPIYLQTQYNNQVYDMASNSIIVIQNGAVIWNSSAFTPVVSHRAYKPAVTAFDWQSWSEPIFTAKQSADEVGAAIPITVGERPYEQLNMTRDLTEFLWYSTVINVAQDGKDVFFVIDSVVGQAFQLFIDGVSVANVWDASHAWVSNIVQMKGSIDTLSAGQHTVSLLATSIGVQNGMNADEDPITAHQQGICIGGNFTIGNQDFTHQTWSHRPYLVGEWLDIASPNNKGGVPWGKPLFHQPATWYTSEFGRFDLPTGYQFSVLFDMNGLTRGHVFINGHDLGRYWNTVGRDIKPTQRYYHIPQDWLYFGGNANMITIFEEIGTASLDKVQIVTSNIVYGSWGDDNDQTKPMVTASE